MTLDADPLLTLVATESAGDPTAASDAGALGLAQARTLTFADLAQRDPALFARRDPLDLGESLLAAALYLAWCAHYLHADLADWSGLEAAVEAYNAVPVTAQQARAGAGPSAIPAETRLHIQRVLSALST